jgi:hypothetical protein
MKLKFFVLFLLTASFPATTHAQSLEEAVEFVYCGDAGWERCIYKAEFDDCTVRLEAESIMEGLVYKVNFDKVIWNSAQINWFKDELDANCSEDCMEDPDGKLDAIFGLYKGRFFSPRIYNVEFADSIVRSMRAIKVIEGACPGVSSTF